jgi:5S rRNA maturation endonuclease (ribonuclease M5)
MSETENPKKECPGVSGAFLQHDHTTTNKSISSTAVERIIDKLEKLKSTGANSWQARCPAHEDGSPSLSVKAANGRALIYCHAGCSTLSIVTALGMRMNDLFDSAQEMTYKYDNGRVAKRFYKLDGSKGFSQSSTDRVPELYQLAKVQAAVKAGRDIFLAEGEEDVRALEALGVVATTAPQGASNWHKVDYTPLKGRSRVYIVQDNDDAGRARAEGLAGHLQSIGVTLAGVLTPKVGNDAGDHVAAGFTIDDFVPRMVEPETSRESALAIRRMSDLPPQPVGTWLGRGFFPRKAITVLVGEEGIGKSLLWVLLVAYVTTGRALAAFNLPAREPADVVVIVTEDDAGEVLARLRAAGADLERVHLFSEDEDGSGSPKFPDAMPVLYAWAEERQIHPALVVVDAWLDTVADGIRVSDTQQGRQALAPWKDVATRLETVVLLVTHTNRLDTANTRDLLGSTVALRQKARMVLFAARHPDDGQEGAHHVWVGPDKSNTTGPANAIRFELKVQQARPETDDDPGTVATLVSPFDTGSTIRSLLQEWRTEAQQSDREPNAVERAEEFVREFMQGRDQAPSKELKEAAAVAGIGQRAISVAMGRVGESRPSAPGEPWVFQSLRPTPTPVKSTNTADTAETGATDHSQSLQTSQSVQSLQEWGVVADTEKHLTCIACGEHLHPILSNVGLHVGCEVAA